MSEDDEVYNYSGKLIPESPEKLAEFIGYLSTMVVERNLPDSITRILKGQQNFRCRVSWKDLVSEYQSHGDWFPLSDEPMLEKIIDDVNKKYAGILHWIEYE